MSSCFSEKVADALPRIMACHGPNPGKGCHSLLLLVLQGMDKLDEKGQAAMYTIMSLLSNVLIYNTYKHIDQATIDTFR